MANPDHLRRLETETRGVSCARLNDVDLSGLDLSKVNLSGAHLKNANLSGCILAGVCLSLADLREADLTKADLTGAYLGGAVLAGANLCGADLTRADFVKTRLNRALLSEAIVDKTDFRGAIGLTNEQLDATIGGGNGAVLDERNLKLLGRTNNESGAITRHGTTKQSTSQTQSVDLIFTESKPQFGDLFLICGNKHPNFAPTAEFGFSQLAWLGIEQTGDYFAICRDGDPVVWISPLINGHVVEHDPGPYDGLRIELDSPAYVSVWSDCVEQFCKELCVPFQKLES